MNHRFLKQVRRWVIRIILLGVFIAFCTPVYARKIEPNWIAVTRVNATLPHLAPEFQGLKMVQISDIHADEWMTQQRLEKIVQIINRQQPDLVVITGDFVTRKAERYAPSLVTALSQLAPQEKTFAVLGNHDHWSSAKVIRKVLKESGIIELRNRVYTLHRENAVLHLAGVDDIWAKKDDLDSVLEQLPDNGAAILLVHEPDFANTSAATGRFDLQLSGHSHGGQVIVPLIGPPRLPAYGQQYPIDRYQVEKMIQYTNRGVGMVEPRVRFNCRPEITVFTLKAK